MRRWVAAGALLCFMTLGTAWAQDGDVAGHYYLQGVREVGSELLLKPDGKFQFMLSYGAADYWGGGTWAVKDESVILNSSAAKGAEPFRLLKSSAVKSDVVRVRVQGPRGNGVPNLDVVLMTKLGALTRRTDSDGVAEFEANKEIKGVVFRVAVYELETKPIALNSAHDDFTFEIDGQSITEMRFEGAKFTIKGNALTTLHWGAEREMKFVKGGGER